MTENPESHIEYIGAKQPQYNWDLLHVINQLQNGTNTNVIKQLKKGGSNLNYVSGSYVIQTLNKLFLNQWSFQVVREIYQESVANRSGKEQNPTVQILGRLTIPGLGLREQWGSSVVTGGADIQESDYKSATTDSLKKCASMFGIAIDLTQEFYPLSSEDLLTERQKKIVYYKNKGALYKEDKPTTKNKKEVNSENEQVEETLIVEEKINENHNTNNESQEPIQNEKENLISDNFTHNIPVVEEEQKINTGNEEQTNNVNNEEQNNQHIHQEELDSNINPSMTYDRNDIEKLKNIKKALNISNNDELSMYLSEFFEDDNANAKYINQKNIKDVIIFLEKKVME